MHKTTAISARLVILVVLSLFIAADAVSQDGAPLASKFDEYLGAAARLGFTGSVLVARDGQVVFSKGYGMANAEWDTPNTPQTKFRLGSVTKQFTAASILLLQERGRLGVRDPICKFFDSCPEAWKEITIHHLLTHTTGIPNFTSFPDYRKTMTIPVTMESLVARFKDKPLDFKPGEKMSYSNSGYVALGHIIERVAGEFYERFVQQNIFDPLKMTGSGYDHHATVLRNRATGYSSRDGKRTNSEHLDMTIPHAAGALYSTVEDLFVWNEALFSDKLLAAASREAMMTVDKNNYGYGLTVNQQHGRKIVAHGGGINGFSTILARFPEEHVTVAVLRNADYGTPNPGRVSQDLAAIAFGEKYEIPRERVAIEIDPRMLDAYVGQYELRPGFVITMKREGNSLMTQATGQPKVEIFPESETRFFFKVVDAQVTFVKDERGVVTHLILHQGGDQTAKKIK